MKRILLIVTAVILSSLAVTGQTEKRVESTVTDVTVFLNRAQVTRKVQTKAEAGKVNFIVQGLTSQIDPRSIQVTGKGRFLILGVGHQRNYLNEQNLPPVFKKMKDSLIYYNDEIKLQAAHKSILDKEELMLQSNQKVGGSNQNLSAGELKAMADFYRGRLTEINLQRMVYEKRIQKMQDRVTALQQQVREQNDALSRNTSEIIVSVAAEENTNVELELRYIVQRAGWHPVYDIRAMDTRKPIQLTYKANVYQSTGEEWKNVKLTLSTGNPSQGGTKPEIHPWYVDIYQPVADKMKRGISGVMLSERDQEIVAPSAVPQEEESASLASYTNVVNTSLNTEFKINTPYTITSTDKPTVVDVAMHSLQADYTYYSAPKLDTDAFLVARISGWGELNLLPGEANIFMEGTFVAKTFVNPNEVSDTLSISLGRDKRIVVQREKIKDVTSRKTFGSTLREMYAFDIVVRNTRSEPVKLIVEDQFPVSKNSQVEVTLTDGGGAQVEASTGKLEWRFLSIPSGEQKKIQYRYEVKYPKDKRVSGL